MKHNWSIICQESIIDQETNRLSLINNLEQLNLPQASFGKDLPIPFEVISYFTEVETDKEKEIEQLIKILDPQNNQIKETKIKVRVPEKFSRFRLRNKIVGMPISTPGMYKFLLFIKVDNGKFNNIAELGVEVLLKNKLV